MFKKMTMSTFDAYLTMLKKHNLVSIHNRTQFVCYNNQCFASYNLTDCFIHPLFVFRNI